MNTTEAIWSSALSNIARTLQPEQFRTWFKDTALVSVSPEKAIVRVPNAFYCKWFELHYQDLIRAALEAELGTPPALRFEIAAPEPPRIQPKPSPPTPARRYPDGVPKLNGNYVFSRFVTGPSNQFAHAAALAAVESPGLAYTPLFLHGGVGLGKTHLMHAVAHALLKKRPDLHIQYLSCEAFMNQFIYALQKGGIERFRARCRQVDALLIDDIHILARRPRTQEEFFHTFNELHNAHKQIILSSDSPPEDIPTIQERLVSRFKWGLVARIDPPCVETRIAIVRKKAELRGRTLPDDVVTFIAEAIPTNIRELEGAVLKTIGYASLTNRPIHIDVAREVLRVDRPNRQPGVVACQRLLEVVARWFGVTPAQLQSKTRARSVAFPRQVCMYLARRLTNKSLQEIGRAIGGRDHSTVAHACDRIERELEADPEFMSTITTLIRQIKAE